MSKNLELELYKFVSKNKLEYHWHNDDVVLIVNFYHLEEFNKLLGHEISDEDGITCTFKDGYICFMMNDICEYFGIDINNIFEKEK